MDRAKVRLGVSAIVAVVGIALPETGWFGPDVARLIVLACVILLVILAGPVVWTWMQPRLPTLPVVFHMPVARRYPKVDIPGGELGFLDFEDASLRAIGQMTSISKDITAILGRSNKMIRDYSGRFERAADASIQTKMRLSRDFAAKLNRYALNLSQRETGYRAAVAGLQGNYVARVRAFPPEADLTSLRAQIESLRETVTSARDTMHETARSAGRARAVNAQQDVNHAWDSWLSVLHRFIEDNDGIIEVAQQALVHIDSRGGPTSPAVPRSPRKTRRDRSPLPPSPGSAGMGSGGSGGA